MAAIFQQCFVPQTPIREDRFACDYRDRWCSCLLAFRAVCPFISRLFKTFPILNKSLSLRAKDLRIFRAPHTGFPISPQSSVKSSRERKLVEGRGFASVIRYHLYSTHLSDERIEELLSEYMARLVPLDRLDFSRSVASLPGADMASYIRGSGSSTTRCEPSKLASCLISSKLECLGEPDRNHRKEDLSLKTTL